MPVATDQIYETITKETLLGTGGPYVFVIAEMPDPLLEPQARATFKLLEGVGTGRGVVDIALEALATNRVERFVLVGTANTR